MSGALVRTLAVGAIGLITASAVEKGFRSGPKKGNLVLAQRDTDILMNSSMTSSDDFLIDGAGKKIRNMFYMDTGILASLTRAKYTVTTCFKALGDRILPLGIAAGAFLIAPIAPVVGGLAIAGLALWGGFNAYKYSGLTKTTGTNILDLKM